jgi:hypothetical protein
MHFSSVTGPKGFLRSDRKSMIRLAGNSGFRVVSRVYLLNSDSEGSRFARRRALFGNLILSSRP